MNKDRFKFRIWDNKFNKYCDNKEIVIDCHSGVVHGNKSFGNGVVKEWVIEQCTGLKDKNGKLIYEGDILSGKTIKERLETIKEKPVAVVKYSDFYNRVLGDIPTSCYDILPERFAELEIIGNIHENPELGLKQ
jgi:uncharacterized phage protein (TIGR01671 family)